MLTDAALMAVILLVLAILLARHWSRPVLFIELDENGLRRFGSSVSAILNHLSQSGYETWWLARTGPHRKATADDIHASVARNGYVDILCLQPPQ